MTVSICCLTYNHEKYIRQCLDGLIMQKTEFDFEILVHDDASSDATQSIINEYVVAYIIRKSKFPQNPKRSVRFSGKRTKRSVQKRKARNTQKAETKVL